jgi:serine protease Do
MRIHQVLLIAGAAAGVAVPTLYPQAGPVVTTRPAASVTITRGGTYIGVNIQEIDADRAKALNLRDVAGVELTRIEKDSPAEKAGLMTGDVVIQYAGQHVEGIEQFSRLVRETPVGRDVKLDIWRNGAAQSMTVKVAARRNVGAITGDGGFQFTLPELPMPDIPRNLMTWRTTLLGVEAESLDGQLATFFGVKEGVLVRSVIAGSASEQAGIKAGDVITRVDDSNVRTPAELSSRVRGLRGKSVPIVLMRDHKEMTLNVMIADQRPSGGTRANRAQRLTGGSELF